MPARFDDRVVIVTGAAGGIGASCAERFAVEGGSVLVTDIDEAKGTAVVERIRGAGGKAVFRAHDVMSEESWIAIVAGAEAEFGALHILVNNAGGNRPSRLVDLSLEDWRFQMALNIDSAFLGMKYAIPAIARHGGGSVVNVSSEAAMNPWTNSAAYCAAKAGLKMLTKVAALESAYDGTKVRVNSIHPGLIRTPAWGDLTLITDGEHGRDSAADDFAKLVTPVKYAGNPTDIAKAVLFLADEENGYVTGAELLVDGGSAIAPPDAVNH